MIGDDDTTRDEGTDADVGELLSLLEDEEEPTDAADDTENTFPDSEDIPKNLRGKPMNAENVVLLAKSHKAALAELTKTKETLADATKKVESKETPDTEKLPYDVLTTLQLSEALNRVQDEDERGFLMEHRQEIENFLASMPLNIRVSPAGVNGAITFIKGEHADELFEKRLERSRSSESSPGITSAGVGATPPTSAKVPQYIKDMSPEERRNLSEWLGKE